MKNKDSSRKLANFSNILTNELLERRNLMNFSFLTKKESPEYLNMDVSMMYYYPRLKFYYEHRRVSEVQLLESIDFEFVYFCCYSATNLIVSLEPLSKCNMPKLKIILLRISWIMFRRKLSGNNRTLKAMQLSWTLKSDAWIF